MTSDQPVALGAKAFLDAFSDCIVWQDYGQALSLCARRLAARSDDERARELREAARELRQAGRSASEAWRREAECGGECELSRPSTISSLQPRALQAIQNAFEALAARLADEEALREVGEQAIGIFMDPWYSAPLGSSLRARLLEISRGLLSTIMADDALIVALEQAPLQLPSDFRRALLEALGTLWWQRELGEEPDARLLLAARQKLEEHAGSMEALVGVSVAGLPCASLGLLCDLLIQVWQLERVSVCGILGEYSPPLLEYGISEVLAEIRRRPLTEPPLDGFLDHFWLATHVVFVLSSYNGCLPNKRAVCPWIYRYIERCLEFWLRDIKRECWTLSPLATRLEAAASHRDEAVDAVAEAMDCLLGLCDTETEAMREAASWLLSRQEPDGLFYSPGADRSNNDVYEALHPTWTAVSALQIGRLSVQQSGRCATWAAYARAAAESIDFQTAPPSAELCAPGAPLAPATGNRRLRVIRACLDKEKSAKWNSEMDDGRAPSDTTYCASSRVASAVSGGMRVPGGGEEDVGHLQMADAEAARDLFRLIAEVSRPCTPLAK